ncbi:hypothetical protein ACM26W_20655 [Halomonas sp. HK25]|uniref:hypothetical protein n=1 Tax=Halomonas sp. HK25 TaxID=3394321 RepID=UPI0039FDDCDD
MAKRRRTTEQQLMEAEERLNQLREKARREETRRHTLIGKMVLERARGCDREMERLMRELDNWLPSGGHPDRKKFSSLGPVRGLYGASLHPDNRHPGWVFNRELAPTAPKADRYGNPKIR